MNVALSRELSFLKISFLRPRRNHEVPSHVATITFDPTWFHYWLTSCHASTFSPPHLLFLHFDFYRFIIYIMGHCYLFILLLFVHHQVLYHSIAMIHIYCLVFASFVIFRYHPWVLYLDLLFNWPDFHCKHFYFFPNNSLVLFHWVLLYMLPLYLTTHSILRLHLICKERLSYFSVMFLALSIIVEIVVSGIISPCK